MLIEGGQFHKVGQNCAALAFIFWIGGGAMVFYNWGRRAGFVACGGDSALADERDNSEADCRWMQRALELARAAAAADEVPVGAVVVRDGEVLAEAGNAIYHGADPLGHAEIIALRAAAAKLEYRHLTGCELYVTLEPCAMCAGAIVLARINRLIYAADDPKAGACGSLYNIPQDERLNHQVYIGRGILAAEAGQLLSEFFRKQRALGKK